MSMAKQGESASLADRLLEDARDHHQLMSVYLLSGFQLKGEVMEFDKDSLLFKHKDVYQLVMRPAIATMYPVPATKAGGGEWWRGYTSQ